MLKISLDTLNRMTPDAFTQALGGIVEHAPWVAAYAAGRRPYQTLGALFDTIKQVILNQDGEGRLDLLRGHPELAGLAARSGSMTA